MVLAFSNLVIVLPAMPAPPLRKSQSRVTARTRHLDGGLRGRLAGALVGLHKRGNGRLVDLDGTRGAEFSPHTCVPIQPSSPPAAALTISRKLFFATAPFQCW